MPSDQFEQLLMQRLDRLEEKLDSVRTSDIPKIKLDVMALVTEHKASSKMYSFIGSVLAIVIGEIIPHR